MEVKLTVSKPCGAKEQLSKFIDENVPQNFEKFPSFAKFDKWLDTCHNFF